MIKFDDVRLEQELTYLFITCTAVENIEWCFEQAGVTDYKVYNHTEFADVVPAHIPIPEVKIIPLPEETTTRIDKRPCVIVSHMNVDDLTEKIYDIIRQEDPDLCAHIKAYQAKIHAAYIENYQDYNGIPIHQ